MKSLGQIFSKGFTLIELVVVILIVGILAVVAVPKYLDLTQQAYTASGETTISAIAAASEINFASWTANGKVATPGGGAMIENLTCADAINVLLSSNPMITAGSSFTYAGTENLVITGANGTTFTGCLIGWPGNTAGTPVTIMVTSSS